MTPFPADVQVCLPGRGCTEYVPGAGQAMNLAIAVGPRVLDGYFTAVLIALVLSAPIVVLFAVLTRHRPPTGARGDRGARASAAALLIAGAALAAVPPLVSPVAPVAAAYTLASSTCVGVAWLVLAPRLPRVASAVLTVAGVLRLLTLPVAVLEYLTAAPLGPWSAELVIGLADLALAFAGLVLLLTGRWLGALRWTLLLPPLAGLSTAIRLGLPFAVGPWIDLLPDVALAVVGVTALVTPLGGHASARGARHIGVRTGGAAAAFALTLAVLLGLPTPGIGGPAAGEPAIGPVRAVTASTRLALPLDEYGQPLADRRVVVRAENRLITTCAARRQVAVPSADLLPPPTVRPASELLGLITARQAAATGYWAPLESVGSGTVDDDHSLRVLADRIRAARARLGDDGRAQGVVDGATYAALTRMRADSRVRRVETAWSRCMQRRGFFDPEPREVARDAATPFPTPQETREASADVACASATNLPGVRAAVLEADEQRMIGAHVTDLAAARSELDAQTRLARSVVPTAS